MKHLKKYNIFEHNDIKISDDKINEIVSDLTKVIENLNNSKDVIRNHIDDLKLINPNNDETNDQIDDSIINLEGSEKLIEDIINKYDETNKSLKNYIKDGKQYLY